MARGAARQGDICTGHVPGFPPRPNLQGSSDVFVNGRPAHRQGDAWAVHCSKVCHPSQLAAGSSSVFANGKPQGRVQDPVACGSRVATGSADVFLD